MITGLGKGRSSGPQAWNGFIRLPPNTVLVPSCFLQLLWGDANILDENTFSLSTCAQSKDFMDRTLLKQDLCSRSSCSATSYKSFLSLIAMHCAQKPIAKLDGLTWSTLHCKLAIANSPWKNRARLYLFVPRNLTLSYFLSLPTIAS